MSNDALTLFQEAKRLWGPGRDIVKVDEQSFRAIHLIQDCLNAPDFKLEHACDRNFFWSVVADDLKRLDRIYSRAKVPRSEKYQKYLVQLNEFDSERFHSLLTLYPYAVNNIDDESYQWTLLVR